MIGGREDDRYKREKPVETNKWAARLREPGRPPDIGVISYQYHVACAVAEKKSMLSVIASLMFK